MILFVALFALPITFLFAHPSPVDLAKLVGERIITDPSVKKHFGEWRFGQAIIAESLIQLSDVMSEEAIDFMDYVNNRYDYFLLTPGQPGYNVTHSFDITLGPALGDYIGLYPFGYLHRARYYSLYPDRAPSNYSGVDLDRRLAIEVADKYILKWNKRWKDGTLSRDVNDAMITVPGWNETGQHEFIWCDDSFMDLTLPARLVSANASNREKYINFIVSQLIDFAKHLRDDEGDMLFIHGQNARIDQHSCCKWGRANGWILMSHVEVLKALPTSHKDFNTILQNFQKHATAVAKVQSLPDGRWHQLLNDTTTYLETSGTAMILWSFIQGVQHKWLSSDLFGSVITSAWKGLASTVKADGKVEGICKGFGLHPKPEDYQNCTTPYEKSVAGLGSVLRAIAAYYTYLEKQ